MPPPSLAHQLAALLPELDRGIHRRLGRDFPHPAPPQSQQALLRLVESDDGITIRQAADRLLMKPNNVSALVTQLTERGLLERVQDRDDKRVAHLRLTATARRDLAAIAELTSGYVAEALPFLTDGELDALGSALGALRSLARHMHAANS
jgi:DNA-binding MarR family transcriptional regulator